ncbi:MAG TPA: hypothetical protein VGR22_02960 [Thermomicrobiales bacterium]|nr:hypothetical protein [Thermomicrobiales bacterium]
MSPAVKATLYGELTTSVILLIALLISAPNATTLLLAVAFGLVVAAATWYQGRCR